MKIETEIETARLILRPAALADVPALFRFLGDENAMSYTRRDASLRDCRRRIAVHERRRRRDGYAPWTVMTKADRRIIGWGGLYNDPFEEGWGIEVGYFFDPAAWGAATPPNSWRPACLLPTRCCVCRKLAPSRGVKMSHPSASWRRPASRC
jgi:RimJ/RimL family protein N-acetyltransferase